MGYDRKYGKVTCERGTIGEDEPVVVFRAQDVLLPDALHAYLLICMTRAGVGAEHLKAIIDAHSAVKEWQRLYGAKVPDTQIEQVVNQVRED